MRVVQKGDPAPGQCAEEIGGRTRCEVATADRSRIKSIRAGLRGTSGEGGTGPNAPVEEELITQITLRNSVQP